jgi:hypothetical protein
MVSAYTLLGMYLHLPCMFLLKIFPYAAELDSRLQCRRAKILWFCGVYFSSTFLSSCSPLQQRMSSRLCTWPPTLEQLRVCMFMTAPSLLPCVPDLWQLPSDVVSIAAVLESILVYSLVLYVIEFLHPVPHHVTYSLFTVCFSHRLPS